MYYQIAFFVSYIVISIVQFAAINDAIRFAFHMPRLVSIFISVLIAPIPIASQTLGMFGAVKIWKWSWLQSILLFWGLLLVPLLFACFVFVADNANAREIKAKLSTYWFKNRIKICYGTFLLCVVSTGFVVWTNLFKNKESLASSTSQQYAAEAPKPIEEPVQIPVSAPPPPPAITPDPPLISTPGTPKQTVPHNRPKHRVLMVHEPTETRDRNTWQRPKEDTPEFILFNGGPAPDYENIYGERGPIDDNTRGWIERQKAFMAQENRWGGWE